MEYIQIKAAPHDYNAHTLMGHTDMVLDTSHVLVKHFTSFRLWPLGRESPPPPPLAEGEGVD